MQLISRFLLLSIIIGVYSEPLRHAEVSIDSNVYICEKETGKYYNIAKIDFNLARIDGTYVCGSNVIIIFTNSSGNHKIGVIPFKSKKIIQIQGIDVNINTVNLFPFDSVNLIMQNEGYNPYLINLKSYKADTLIDFPLQIIGNSMISNYGQDLFVVSYLPVILDYNLNLKKINRIIYMQPKFEKGEFLKGQFFDKMPKIPKQTVIIRALVKDKTIIEEREMGIIYLYNIVSDSVLFQKGIRIKEAHFSEADSIIAVTDLQGSKYFFNILGQIAAFRKPPMIEPEHKCQPLRERNLVFISDITRIISPHFKSDILTELLAGKVPDILKEDSTLYLLCKEHVKKMSRLTPDNK